MSLSSQLHIPNIQIFPNVGDLFLAGYSKAEDIFES